MVRRASHIFLMLAVSLLILSVPGFAQSKQKVTFGVLVDGKHRIAEQALDVFKMEILELLQDDFDVDFPPEKVMVSSVDPAKSQQDLAALLDDPEVDVIIAMGLISSQTVCCVTNLTKPVFAPFVLDAELQKPPLKDGTSGVKNLNYLASPDMIRQDILGFREIIPFKKLGILLFHVYGTLQKNMVDETVGFAKGIGLEAEVIYMKKGNVKEVLAKLGQDFDAVYLASPLFISENVESDLINGINALQLPSFSISGESAVKQGVLAGMSTDTFMPRRARRIAINIQKVLLGDVKPEELPVVFRDDRRLTINMSTARKINSYPSWEALTEAKLIKEKREDIKRVLSLSKAINKAVSNNLDLIAKDFEVQAGAHDIKSAKSNLFPQLEASATGTLIDDDRASASMGSQAEKTFTGGATLTQVLFSEPAFANVGIQKSLQVSRENELRELKYNLAVETAIAYLNLLQAKTYESIQRNNLKLTRSNYELAKIREMVGTAHPAEVLRWDSQIAQSRSDVISANARRNVAEIQLNRYLHMPAESPFRTEEEDLKDPYLLINPQRVFSQAEDPAAFKKLREFLVVEGLNNSPEIQQLDAAIEVVSRSSKSTIRSFYLPSVALQGQYINMIDKSGAGSEGLTLPPQFGDVFGEPADDHNWSVAVNVSLPLFNGGSRFVQKQKDTKQLRSLKLQRKSVAEKLEQQIRSNVHIAGASFASITQAKKAQEAARKTLELVQESYANGLVSILDLLDAQNAALQTDLAYANAIYQFLIDDIKVQRSVGVFEALISATDSDAFYQRMNDYFAKSGND